MCLRQGRREDEGLFVAGAATPVHHRPRGTPAAGNHLLSIYNVFTIYPSAWNAARSPQTKECGFGCGTTDYAGIQNAVISAARLNSTSAGERG